MKRFITYLFEYERGKKGKNIGFIRADLRNAICRMEIHMRNKENCQGSGQVYLLVNPQKLTGLPLGSITVSRGRGEAGYTFSADGIAGSDYRFSDIIGVGIYLKDRCYAASCWTDTAAEWIADGHFIVWQKEAQNKEAAAVESAAEMSASKQPAPEPPKIRAERIDINGIRQLSKKNHHLSTNSFVVHGYLNYHHLMKKEIKKNDEVQQYLGVPGVYERQECMMALLFGFPKFETEKEFYRVSDDDRKGEKCVSGAEDGGDMTDAAPPEVLDGTFGYWVCGLKR